MKLKSLIFTFILLPQFMPIVSGQNIKRFDKLQGYWMEAGNSNLSYESIFIFDFNDEGILDGTAYFFDSGDETLEYSISTIIFNGDSLQFEINGTSIYFEGVLNNSQTGINGYLVLADKTRLKISHEKVDLKTFRSLTPEGGFRKEKILKKQINAGSGLDIG